MIQSKYSIFLLCILVFIFIFSPVQLTAQQQNAAVFFERGKNFMANEDWYSAIESLLECLRLNSAHAEGTAAIAECYYER